MGGETARFGLGDNPHQAHDQARHSTQLHFIEIS